MLNGNLNWRLAERVEEQFDVDKLWSKPLCHGVMSEPDERKPQMADDTHNMA